MSPAEDLAVQMARDAASEGVEAFKATLDFYQDNPNPDPRARRHGGVALPGMGRRPPSPGGAGPGKGPSKREQEAWRKEAEAIALRTMMEARRDFIPDLFRNARLTYKGGRTPAQEARAAATNFAKAGKKIAGRAESDQKKGRSWSASSTPAKSVSSPQHGPRELGKKVFQILGEVDATELKELEGPLTDLAGDIFSDLGSSLMPLVGTAKTGVKAASRWAKTGKRQAQASKTKKARGKVVQGDPDRAVASVKRLLERERNLMAAEAGMATAKLGGDIAGYFVDLGIASSIVSGCAEAVARLGLHVRQLVRDARELKAANELLRSGRPDHRIFEACPLLGAYAVAAADTSALVGFLGGDPQRHGFTLDDLSKVIRKYERPVVKYATEMIQKSRLEVQGMPTDRAQVRSKIRAQESSLRRKVVDQVKRKLGTRPRF